MLRMAMAFTAAALASHTAMAQSTPTPRQCGIPAATVQAIQSQLANVAPMNNGGLFSPSQMWSAVVDREGILCSVIKIHDAWPGSRDIAIAKASTANDFSNQKLALSTAMLYGPTQPGGSLYGLNNSNPFNPLFNQQGTGLGNAVGGIITFGGGVALYSGGKVIGGLGVSGDTSCADHVIAYRMRRAAGFDAVPGGVGADNIQYYPAGTTITTLDPTQFAQPHCSAKDIAPGDI
jgi:uncharacterized protein GlcG (DUF336 family)